MRNYHIFWCFFSKYWPCVCYVNRKKWYTPSLSPHLQIFSGPWHLSSSSPLEKIFEGDFQGQLHLQNWQLLFSVQVLELHLVRAGKQFWTSVLPAYPAIQFGKTTDFLTREKWREGAVREPKWTEKQGEWYPSHCQTGAERRGKNPEMLQGRNGDRQWSRERGSTGGQSDTCHHKSPLPGLWVCYSRPREPPESLYTVFFSRSQDRKQSVSPPFVWYLAAVLKNTS